MSSFSLEVRRLATPFSQMYPTKSVKMKVTKAQGSPSPDFWQIVQNYGGSPLGPLAVEY